MPRRKRSDEDTARGQLRLQIAFAHNEMESAGKALKALRLRLENVKKIIDILKDHGVYLEEELGHVKKLLGDATSAGEALGRELESLRRITAAIGDEHLLRDRHSRQG